MNSGRLAILSLVVFFLVLTSCKQKDSQSPLDYSKSLIIVSGAMNVIYSKPNGMDSVRYKLFVNYPASEIINQIDFKLKNTGWKFLEKDFLNPDIPTSHVRGWGSYINGTENPEREVHAWSSNWKNQNGDVISYSFKYSYPVHKKPEFLILNELFDLDVVAVFVPSDLANSIMKQLNSLRKNQ
jgi:hypothetical protein